MNLLQQENKMSLFQDINDIKVSPLKQLPEAATTTLIKELSGNGSVQALLKKSDGTDAGSTDIENKATSKSDIGFNLMRNTINTDGPVSGSDITNYIERAEELNDEIDTVPFGLETDDGQIVKVYVNAEQADAFAEAMKNMLGMEDDIEEAINSLATKFDIVDVVWPESDDEAEVTPDADADISIDDDFTDDNYDVIAADDQPAYQDTPLEPKAKPETEDEEDADVDPDAPADSEEADESDQDEEDEDDAEPKVSKKKKKAKPAEPADINQEDIQVGNNMTTLGSKFLSRVLGEAKTKKLTEPGWYVVDHMDKPVEGPMQERGAKASAKEMSDAHSKKHGEGDIPAFDVLYFSDYDLKRMNESLLEAEDADGVRDGFNIPLDARARAMASRMKLPLAKRLIAFHAMAGVPGRYLSVEDAENTILEAADMLRKKVSIRRAFLSLYDSLANAKGYTIPADVKEAKDAHGEAEYQTFAAWKRAAKQKHEGVWFDGDEDIANAMVGDKPFKRGKTRSVGEWDGSVGWLKAATVTEASQQKRGGIIQKLLETVMVGLGLPENLVTSSGPSAVSTGIYRTAELIEADATLERILRNLAARMGIKASDVAEPVHEGKKGEYGYWVCDSNRVAIEGAFDKKADAEKRKKELEKDDDELYRVRLGYADNKRKVYENLEEATDAPGEDDYTQEVFDLVEALGIPGEVLRYKAAQTVTSLRKKKMSLKNKNQVMALMGRLQKLLVDEVKEGIFVTRLNARRDADVDLPESYLSEGIRKAFAADLDKYEREMLAAIEKKLGASIDTVSQAQVLSTLSSIARDGKIGGQAARYDEFVADLKRVFKGAPRTSQF